MTSNKLHSIYFLTSAESKVRAYCDICHHEPTGIACIYHHETLTTSIIVRCHGKTFGLRITDQLVDAANLSGFMVKADESLHPMVHVSKMEPKLTSHTLKLDDAIRQAKEKIYKKIYGGGTTLDASKFGLVRGAMISPELETKEREMEEEEIYNNGRGRRIVMH